MNHRTEYARRHGVPAAALRYGVSERTVYRWLAADPVDEITGNVLVIGDLHEPFSLDGYLDFTLEVQDRYDCDNVVFIGDVIDNHYPSYHEIDPDGLGGKDELDLAVERLSRWVTAYPDAHVLIGNHDRMVMRKAMTGNVPRRWIRDYTEVLEAPGWQFVDELTVDGVQYLHGEGGTARARCRKDLCSTVQGHLHTQAYVEHYVGRTYSVWGMQVGCGIDRHAYAMAYAKNGPKPAIGCGVVIDEGRQPISILMRL